MIVPGYEDVDGTVSTIALDALRAAHARGARLVSICTGAFALAATGLLDGRPATTHWRWADELQPRYPRVNVIPNRLFVDDGDILTSAGVTTGIDLCLHIIRRDHGAAAANNRARALVAPPQRQGGQAQFVERLRPETSDDQLAALRDWMLENLALPLDLDTLATHAHVSRRTLTRRFREETGLPPMAWLTDARIDRARELLETTTEPVENIGRLTGLGAPAVCPSGVSQASRHLAPGLSVPVPPPHDVRLIASYPRRARLDDRRLPARGVPAADPVGDEAAVLARRPVPTRNVRRRGDGSRCWAGGRGGTRCSTTARGHRRGRPLSGLVW